MCPSYKTQLNDMSDQLKKKEEYIERLKEEMNKMAGVRQTTTKKVTQKSIAHPKTNKRESNNRSIKDNQEVFLDLVSFVLQEPPEDDLMAVISRAWSV